MPRELRLDIVVVAACCLLTLIIAVWFLVHRTRIHFAAVLIAGVLTLGVVEPTIPVLLQYCNESVPHIDCVPDRYDRVARGITWRVIRVLPTEAHLMVAVLAVTVAAAVAWRIGDLRSK